MAIPKVKYNDEWKECKDIFIKRYGVWTSITEIPEMPLTAPSLRDALKTQLTANHPESYTVTGSIITHSSFGVGDLYLDAIATITNRIIFIPQEASSKILILNCNNDTVISFPNTTGMRLRGSYHGSGKVFLFGQDYSAANNGWFPVYEFNYTTGEITRIAWSPFAIRNCWLGPGGAVWGDGLPIISTTAVPPTNAKVSGGLTMYIPEKNMVGGIGYSASSGAGGQTYNTISSMTLSPIDRVYDIDHLFLGTGGNGREQANGRILFGTASGLTARTSGYGKFVDSIIYNNVSFSAPITQSGTYNTIVRRNSLSGSTSFNFTTGATGDTTFTNTNRFHRGIMGPNGRVYFSPTNHPNALEISQNGISSYVARAVNIPTGINGYGQGAMSLDNNIYFCPLGSGNIAKLTFTGNFTKLSPDLVLSTWIQQQ